MRKASVPVLVVTTIFMFVSCSGMPKRSESPNMTILVMKGYYRDGYYPLLAEIGGDGIIKGFPPRIKTTEEFPFENYVIYGPLKPGNYAVVGMMTVQGDRTYDYGHKGYIASSRVVWQLSKKETEYLVSVRSTENVICLGEFFNKETDTIGLTKYPYAVMNYDKSKHELVRKPMTEEHIAQAKKLLLKVFPDNDWMTVEWIEWKE